MRIARTLTLSTQGKRPVDVRKAAIAMAGLKQTDIARLAGVTRQAVHLVMHGRRRSDVIEQAIADATGIPRARLFPPRDRSAAA